MQFSENLNVVNSGFRVLAEGQINQSVLKHMVSTSREGKEAAISQYIKYKENFVKHLRFDPESPTLSIMFLFSGAKLISLISVAMIEHPPLEAVFVFFDTATFDQIERDVKVTFRI